MKYLGYSYDHAFKELLERRHQVRIDPFYKKCIKLWGFEVIGAKNKARYVKEVKQEDVINFQPLASWKDHAENERTKIQGYESEVLEAIIEPKLNKVNFDGDELMDDKEY